ncbi:MAG: PQQ-binding-like beta-propeller repeat protein [Gemmatimonadota bacterium]
MLLLALAAWVQGAIAQRTVRDLTLSDKSMLWIRGSETDTTILDPNRMLVSNGRIFLTDPQGPAVVGLDARTGRTIWRYSKRGSGPGEFRAPALASWHPQGVVVADNDTHRLYLFSTDGALAAEQAVPMGQFVAGLCSFANGDVLLYVPAPPSSALITVRLGSRVTNRFPFPFDPSSPNLMAHALDLASVPANKYGCVASKKTEDGIATLNPESSPVVGKFVERLEQRAYKPPAQIRDTSDIPIPFSLRTGFDGTSAYVWFGGKSCASRCIDFYSMPALRYSYSLRIQGKTGIGIRDLAIDGRVLYLLGSRDGFPVLAAFTIPK